MKTKSIQLMAMFILGIGTIFAQDIPESQVPSVIVNNFKKEFPKANDAEWERKGDQYNVDFELGWLTDYEAWYSASGKQIRYTMEVSYGDLPKAVTKAIKSQYAGYRVDDAKKIVEKEKVTYKVDIENGNHELELVYSKDGKLNKK